MAATKPASPSFQFTHPGRGATRPLGDACAVVGVSIHAPREGCDGRSLRRGGACGSFNSRTPGGVRRAVIILWASRLACFNSRTPGGVRQRRGFRRIYPQRFQFTHPGRGATAPAEVVDAETGVSIHAPREGCDVSRLRAIKAHRVSIHAPREGCDCNHRGMPLVSRSFNSRTPGGVRLDVLTRWLDKQTFQFTHPGRGATDDAGRRYLGSHPFQFTHPGRGATQHAKDERAYLYRFNSRTPGGVRLPKAFAKSTASKFQFTHPGRGATHSQSKTREQSYVSIHAPREGCDRTLS